MEVSCRCFSLDEVLVATNKFDDAYVIGKGGFGKVYQGFIDHGAMVVAIKRMNAESKQRAREFWTEVNMLSKLRHTHLVALIGYCNECEEMILVYEYIARGTLADHLYKLNLTKSNTGISSLPWERRLNICIGAARGLEHLHCGTSQSFIHRDVKTTNILIDSNWVSKISDFGVSKGTTSHSITHISTEVKGTFGYLDPDYVNTHRLTTKSDVYAFGVVLLEVLCGRPAVDRKLDKEKISLVNWAQQCIKKGKLAEVIDPSLSGQIARHCLKSFVVLAEHCLHRSPESRPTMAEVLGRLELTLLSQQRGKTEGIMTKAFHSMDRWLRERKDGSSSSGQTNDSPGESDSKTVTQLYHLFSLDDIRAATKDFNKSFLVRNSSKVYKGLVTIDGEGLMVAIKRFKKLKAVGDGILPKKLLPHPNILSPVGFCTKRDELILVHHYMPNGSLQDHLRYTDTPLSWEMRLRICIGAAQGLEYLLTNGERELIHRRIEPSSILLDENWVAKVMLPNMRTTTNDSAGLLRSPLMHYNSIYQEDDLYSFGVMLLEVLICNERLGSFFHKRKQLGDHRNPKHPDVPLKYYLDDILQSENIYQVMDPHLVGKIGPDCLREFVKITLSCLLLQGTPRLSIDDVVRSLQFALHLQENWQSRIASTTGDLF